MAITHTWSIEGVSAHKFNTNCVNNVKFKLTSTDGEVTKEKTFDCGIAATASPVDLSKDPSTFDWYDQNDGFIPTEDLTADLLWSWVDEREDRVKLELEMEQEFLTGESTAVPLSLSF